MKVPDDFQVTLASAGLGVHRAERDSVTISANGECRFWSGSNIEGDTSIKKEKSFNIPKALVSRIYQAVVSNQFTRLDPEYRDSGIRDGDLAELTVRMNREIKVVRSVNSRVADFDNIAKAINSELPEEFRIKYNALAGF